VDRLCNTDQNIAGSGRKWVNMKSQASQSPARVKPGTERTFATAGRTIPGPSHIVSFDEGVDPIDFLGSLLREYGDVVQYRTSFGPSFIFAHPKHVQMVLQRENLRRASLVKMVLADGLLASDGPFWRSQRQLMQKDFQPARVAVFADIITQEIVRTEAEWSAAARTGEEVDVMSAMTRLTLRIIVKSLFSDDLMDDHAAALCGSVTQTITELGKISWTIFGAPFHFSPAANSEFAAAKKIMDDTCYEMIARRRMKSSDNRPGDLLDLLISTPSLTDVQVRDEIVTMLVGGHETTALALSWGWKSLSEDPQVAKRLHDEVDEVLGDESVHTSHLPKLPWTRACFHEAMRLYPPVWYMGRVGIETDEIDGYVIPRSACVMISPWFTHRHRDFWQSPDAFDPSRFLESAPEPGHKYAYFPFAGGRHQCLGMHLALMEGVFILAQLSRRFAVLPTNAAQVRPLPGITLRQTPNLRAKLEPRSSKRMCGTARMEAR
jgi:cytochrome P450